MIFNHIECELQVPNIFLQEPPASSTQEQNGIDLEANPQARSPVNPQPFPIGYPALAEFIGSDSDFFVFRRFNALSARSLLHLQHELSELEEKLELLDREDYRRTDQSGMLNLHSLRDDGNRQRKELMKVISEKMQAYRAKPRNEPFLYYVPD